jgi:uncharacterized membrane protein
VKICGKEITKNSRFDAKSYRFLLCANFCSFFISEMISVPFLSAGVLKKAVHPLPLPLLHTQSCVLGLQIVCHVCIHLFSVCGVGMEAVAMNAAGIVISTVPLWAEKVTDEVSAAL